MSIENPTEVAETLADRLRAATVQHRDAREVAQRKAKTWRELIVECVDAGARTKDVAAAAGISSARVHAIIVSEYSRP